MDTFFAHFLFSVHNLVDKKEVKKKKNLYK